MKIMGVYAARMKRSSDQDGLEVKASCCVINRSELSGMTDFSAENAVCPYVGPFIALRLRFPSRELTLILKCPSSFTISRSFLGTIPFAAETKDDSIGQLLKGEPLSLCAQKREFSVLLCSLFTVHFAVGSR